MMKAKLTTIALSLALMSPVLTAAGCPDTKGSLGMEWKENGDPVVTGQLVEPNTGLGVGFNWDPSTGRINFSFVFGGRDAAFSGSMECEGGQEQGEFIDQLEVGDTLDYEYQPHDDGSGCGTVTMTNGDGETTDVECCESGSDDADRYEDGDDDNRIDDHQFESASSNMDW